MNEPTNIERRLSSDPTEYGFGSTPFIAFFTSQLCKYDIRLD